MSYKVYKIRYPIAIPDPDMPPPRYHTVIFVATSQAANNGIVHHVTGDITSGMSYTTRPLDPSEPLHSKEYLGTILVSDYPHEMDEVLRAQPPPPKQKSFNIKSMRAEQTKPGGAFYEVGEERPKMVKCTEWVVEQAIPALCASGVLKM